MTDDEQKAAERELVDHLRKHPEVVEAVKRAAPTWNAAMRQIAGRKIPDPSRPHARRRAVLASRTRRSEQWR